jgi:hypothetical protein
MKAGCVALGAYMIKIEQQQPYFECALSNSQQILNACRATIGASMVSLEQQKNVPNFESANKIHLSLN